MSMLTRMTKNFLKIKAGMRKMTNLTNMTKGKEPPLGSVQKASTREIKNLRKLTKSLKPKRDVHTVEKMAIYNMKPVLL